MKFWILLLIVAGLMIMPRCKFPYYQSTDAVERTKKHRLIAVLPPEVFYQTTRKMEDEDLRKLIETTSVQYQKEIHSWIVTRKKEGRSTVGLQELERTNSLLYKAGFWDGRQMTAEDVCRVLEVDGFISSKFRIEVVIPRTAAIILDIFDKGEGLTTGYLNARLELHDQIKGDIIWQSEYDETLTGTTTHHERLDRFIRKSTATMPYFSKR